MKMNKRTCLAVDSRIQIIVLNTVISIFTLSYTNIDVSVDILVI